MVRMRRRPSVTAAVSALTVGGAVLFVLLQLQPGLLLADTTPSGGDMGAHVWGPAYLRDHLLPHGRLTGWAPDWYAGFPFLTFYFPLPSLLIVLVDLFLPYAVAFKLVSVLGLVSLPVAAWAFGHLAGLRAPAPACLAVATVPFVFDRTFTIYGGNIPSTLAGEFSFSISLSLALVFLGVLARSLATGRHRALAAGLLALTLLCHVIPTFFAIAGAVVLVLLRPGRRRLVDAVVVGVVAGLLTAFWALPFVARLAYTNDMGWEKVEAYRQNLMPHDLRWLGLLATVGALASLLRRSLPGTFLTAMAVLSAVGFVLAPQGKIWNARLLPFWFLCLYLLAGLALEAAFWLAGRAAARTRPQAPEVVAGLTPPLVLMAAVVFVGLPLGVLPSWVPLETQDRSFVPAWVRWNYAGYERKDSWPEYRDVVRTMEAVGRTVGCGRAVWEYEEELNRLGTPMALFLLPYWTKGCIGSMEGLYFESSATTPYHFLTVSELSLYPSRPQRDLPYRDFDLARGVRHLQLLGVRYYMATSPEVQGAARQHPDLRLVASAGPFPVTYSDQVRERTWEVYEVAGSELVAPLDHEPVVMTGVGRGEKAWLASAVGWFQDEARWPVPLADQGPRSWQRVRGADPDPPRRPVRPAVVSGVRTSHDRISFDVDRPGAPVLVKASYFPNWQASGARGPWRVTPNFMVVVPTSRHVELHYGTTAVDRAGWALTLAGVVALVVLARGRRPDQPSRLPPTEEDVAARAEAEEELVLVSAPLSPQGEAEAHQPQGRADPAAQDRRPRRPGLPDGHRDLGHPEPGPLGPEDELGVEQVGPESALLDDR